MCVHLYNSPSRRARDSSDLMLVTRCHAAKAKAGGTRMGETLAGSCAWLSSTGRALLLAQLPARRVARSLGLQLQQHGVDTSAGRGPISHSQRFCWLNGRGCALGLQYATHALLQLGRRPAAGLAARPGRRRWVLVLAEDCSSSSSSSTSTQSPRSRRPSAAMRGPRLVHPRPHAGRAATAAHLPGRPRRTCPHSPPRCLGPCSPGSSADPPAPAPAPAMMTRQRLRSADAGCPCMHGARAGQQASPERTHPPAGPHLAQPVRVRPRRLDIVVHGSAADRHRHAVGGASLSHHGEAQLGSLRAQQASVRCSVGARMLLLTQCAASTPGKPAPSRRQPGLQHDHMHSRGHTIALSAERLWQSRRCGLAWVAQQGGGGGHLERSHVQGTSQAIAHAALHVHQAARTQPAPADACSMVHL